MKVWKKCGALFLTVLLCITMMAVPALAASDSQELSTFRMEAR